MSANEATNDRQLPQDGTDLSSKLSYDESNNSKFDNSSIDDNISHFPADDDFDNFNDIKNDDNKVTSNHIRSKLNYDNDDDDDDVFAMHSIPHPDEIPRAKHTKSLCGGKAMQTFAGVAGNVLEWYVFILFFCCWFCLLLSYFEQIDHYLFHLLNLLHGSIIIFTFLQ